VTSVAHFPLPLLALMPGLQAAYSSEEDAMLHRTGGVG
jgi:hypothetical protein